MLQWIVFGYRDKGAGGRGPGAGDKEGTKCLEL